MASTFPTPHANMTSGPYKSNWGSYYSDGTQDYQSPPTSTSESSTPAGKSPKDAPSEPRSNHPYSQPRPRQLYERNGPLYIPAALRPTEPPQKHSPPKHGIKACGSKTHSRPPTPPRSADGEEREDPMRNLLGEGTAKQTMIRMVTDEWRIELEDVTGRPTDQHWKPDSAATVCDFASCLTNFSIFQRRHHCRRCGLIFCSEHSLHAVPLDQHARFHPDGVFGRACDCCWHDFKVWDLYRTSRRGSRSDTSCESSGATTPRVDCSAETQGVGQTRAGQQGQETDSVAGAQDIDQPSERPPRRGQEQGHGELYFGSYCGGLTWSTF